MNRNNWVGKLHDYVDEEGYGEVSKLIANVEAQAKLKGKKELLSKLLEATMYIKNRSITKENLIGWLNNHVQSLEELQSEVNND